MHKRTKCEFAMKFFQLRAMFQAESAHFTGTGSHLRKFLPPVHSIMSNADGKLMDAGGTALPPCIVMERGESLNLWMQRNARGMDTFTCMQVSTLHFVNLELLALCVCSCNKRWVPI